MGYYNKNIYSSYNFKTKRGVRRPNKKAKYRQQKLSIDTIIKISKREAKKLDKADDIIRRFSLLHAADGFTWQGQVDLPAPRYWRPVPGSGMESQVISDFEGYINDPIANQIDAAQGGSLTVKITAVQARIAVRNYTRVLASPYYLNNMEDCKITAMLIYVPNLNNQTTDAVDFLRPDNFMLYKRGSGNLVYDGLDKQTLRNAASSQSSVRDYTILARRVINMESQNSYPNDITTPTVRPIKTKYITLSKYFKTPKTHNIKYSGTPGGMITDGNYYMILYSNLSTSGLNTFSYVAATTVAFKVGATTFPVNS